MYRIMEKYNKKMLAIVMAFLMIAFIIPQFNRGQRGANDIVYGTIGDEKVSAADVQEAKAQWDYLRGGREVPFVIYKTTDPRTQQPDAEPIAYFAFGKDVVEEIDKTPVLFLLLQPRGGEKWRDRQRPRSRSAVVR